MLLDCLCLFFEKAPCTWCNLFAFIHMLVASYFLTIFDLQR